MLRKFLLAALFLRDSEWEKEYALAHPEWSKSNSVGSNYFYIPSDFNAIGKTYKECLAAGCYEITKEEDL